MKNLLVYLRAARMAFGPTMTNDQCVNLINDVLAAHGEGLFALGAAKPGGNYGTRRDGKRCVVDGVVYGPDRTFIDVFIDGGGKSTPSWQVHELPPRGTSNPFDRALVWPIGQEAHTDAPAPVHIDSPMIDPRLSVLADRLGKVEARVQSQGEAMRDTLMVIQDLVQLQNLLAEAFRRIDALEKTRYQITGAANRYLRLGVEKVQE